MSQQSPPGRVMEAMGPAGTYPCRGHISEGWVSQGEYIAPFSFTNQILLVLGML